MFAVSRRPKPKLEVISLNKEFQDIKQQMYKLMGKKRNKIKKNKYQKEKPSLYVIDFCGDIKASQVEQLREEITAILTIAKPEDEIVVRLESLRHG